MTKKEELSQYRSLKKEIEYIDSKINSYRTQVTVKASGLEFPYIQKTVTIKGLQQSSTNDVIRLRNRKQQCVSFCDKIENFIDSIEDSIMRQIVTLRYIDGLSWRDTAQRIGGGNSESAVKVAWHRYLKNL